MVVVRADCAYGAAFFGGGTIGVLRVAKSFKQAHIARWPKVKSGQKQGAEKSRCVPILCRQKAQYGVNWCFGEEF